MSGWGEKLADIWTNNVAPSRPSCSEVCVYTKYLNLLRQKINRKIKLLILGSTPEFRDWGYDEDLDITVVDKSQRYYNNISRELRHKNIKEKLYIQSWEDMCFPDSYDIIIGDLAIGNVDPDRFDDFLQNVDAALSLDGIFMGKSMIWNEKEPVYMPSEIVRRYKDSVHIHPYTYINHQLAMYCLDRKTNMLDFGEMYKVLNQLYQDGGLDEEIFAYFKNVGWNTEMKFEFFAPTQKQFIDCVNKYMKFVKFEHTTDIYSNVFPIYIIEKR